MKSYVIQTDATMPYVYLDQAEIDTWDWWEDGEQRPPKFDSYQLFADGVLYGSNRGQDVAEFICDNNDVQEYGLRP